MTADDARAAGAAMLDRRRCDSGAPLPMEVVRLFHGELLPALAAHAPGAAFPDRSYCDPEGWGPAHRGWREGYPAAAAALDRMWARPPYTAEFLARLLDAIGVIARGEAAMDSDDF